MIWVIIALALALVMALWWIAHGTPPKLDITAGDKTIDDDFAAKKKAEAERIAGASPQELLKDANDDLSRP